MVEKNNKNIVKAMLIAVGENPNREGLKETPARVVKSWKELFRGYDKSLKPNVTIFKNGSDGIVYDEMITDTGDFYSQCEHHIIPFYGRYWFAYIPHPKGNILGLSKVARVVDYHSAKLQIQERLVHDITEQLWEALCKGSKYKPIAMGFVMEGEHLCKTMRGVKKKGKMRTTELRGTIKTNASVRSEFLDVVNNKQ